MTAIYRSIRGFVAGLPMLVAAMLLATASAPAVTLNVECDGVTPGAFPSINAALAALPDKDGPHTLVVSGTCRENLFLENWQRLTIESAAGTTATIISPVANKHVIEIWSSTGLVFRRLLITGGNRGLQLTRGSEALLDSSRIDRINGAGLWVTFQSIAHLQGTPAEPMLITNNNAAGIFVLDGSVVMLAGNTRIENNGGHGINVISRGIVDAFGTGNLIAGNGWRVNGNGVRVVNGTAELSGIDISNNVARGVWAEHNSVIGLALATIRGNGLGGLEIRRMSSAKIGLAGGPVGPVEIAGNGQDDLTCDTTSLVTGDLAGVAEIDCPRIERELGPPRPGEEKDEREEE